MKKQTSINGLQRGSLHVILAIGAIVALVGVLGFVGYNSLQKTSSNAGGGGTVAVASTAPDIKKPATLAYNAQGLCTQNKDLYAKVAYNSAESYYTPTAAIKPLKDWTKNDGIAASFNNNVGENSMGASDFAIASGQNAYKYYDMDPSIYDNNGSINLKKGWRATHKKTKAEAKLYTKYITGVPMKSLPKCVPAK